MERIMAVLSKEPKYAERLCSYVNRKNSLILKAVPFGDAASCGEFSRKHNVELLLTDVGMEGSGYGVNPGELSRIRAKKIIRLSDSGPFEKALADGPASGVIESINKYQPAERLIREVMSSCEGMELRNAAEAAGKPVRIIGVYSPVSRSGKSSFALTLSKILGKKRRVLYLNLEEFSCLGDMTGEEYSFNLSDALYHVKQGTLTSQRIYSMIYSFSGIDYIPPITYADDRTAVKGEDFVQLISVILRNTAYETIVADMDRFADEASDIMEICNTVYMPVLDNYMDRMRVDHFMEYLDTSGRENIAEKIVRVTVPEPETKIQGNYASYIDFLSYGPMGDMIRSLKGVGA